MGYDISAQRIAYLCFTLWKEQQEYEEYWVRNSWGFGDKMRDYLFEGWRTIKLLPKGYRPATDGEGV